MSPGDTQPVTATLPARGQGRQALTWIAVAKTVGALVLGVVWAGRRVRHTYFYFDEWSMIGRVAQLGPLEGATASFNGHLWLFQDLIFRTQALVFGLNSNSFLVAVFLAALVSLHFSLTFLAVRAGAPLLVALALGGLLTYLGPAAQNFVFAIQVSPTFATASAIGATAIALGGTNGMQRCIAVAALLLVATLFDSGVGLLALLLGGGTVVGLWPRRQWWVMAPAGLVTAGWYLFADLGPEFEASIGDRIEFAGRLVVRGAGALAGGEVVAGFVVLALFGVVAAVAVRSGRMNRAGWTLTIAAAGATVVNVAGIAQSRAGLQGFTFFENNRYLQNVGLPLSLVLLPAAVICARLIGERWSDRGAVYRMAIGAVPLLLIGTCFVLGLDEEGKYVDVFLERNERVRTGVNQIGVISVEGCAEGAAPDPNVRPLGALSPQISVGLIDELTERGLLVIDMGGNEAGDPEIRRVMCAS